MANVYIKYWGKNLYKPFTNQISMKNYNLMGNSPGSGASIFFKPLSYEYGWAAMGVEFLHWNIIEKYIQNPCFSKTNVI